MEDRLTALISQQTRAIVFALVAVVVTVCSVAVLR
jgi:hypothetical protein